MTRSMCPGCAAPVDKLAPSPNPHQPARRCARCRATGNPCRPHLVAAYPCGCWMTLTDAAAMAAAGRQEVA